jgi:hypothetical protein
MTMPQRFQFSFYLLAVMEGEDVDHAEARVKKALFDKLTPGQRLRVEGPPGEVGKGKLLAYVRWAVVPV